MKKVIKIKLLLVFISINYLTAQTTSELLIRSSFNNIIVDKTVVWNHHLRGTDTVTNYVFPDDLPGNFIEHYFNYVVGDMDHYADYANAEIVNTIGYDGNPTNALYIEFIRDDTNFPAYSRVQYEMFGDDTSNDPVQRMNQGYIKYRIKTHIDHTDTISDWRLPIEWKDMEDDGFRMGLYIYDSNTNSPYWVAKGQYMINGELGDDVWQFDNYDIPVIEDDWFELEIYWYGNADPNLGRFKIAINGQILFDITNQTKDPNQPNKMFYFMPFKVYGTAGYSFITDFEYWDKPPPSSVLYESSLGTHNKDTISNRGVYPIPTSRFLNISKENLGLAYQISTISGIMILKGVVENQILEVSSLKKGVYFIKFTDEFQNVIQLAKFIKK